MLSLLNRIPPDKARHFLVGSLLAALGALHSVLVGLLLCAAFALGKELRDRITRRGTPDWLDALWTLLGAVPVLLPLAVWRLQ